MKKNLSIGIVAGLLALASCTGSATVEKTETQSANSSTVIPGSYGASVAEAEVLTTAQLLNELNSTETFTGQVVGQINEVCTKKGCWLTMDLAEGQSMRVTFKDYGFFVPTDSQGFPIVLEGVASIVETDVETLRHFAEDQGKSQEEIDQITAPKREITFEATGVIIKDKA